MNWDDVKVFLLISRNTRLEEAAVRANVDATTISRRIKRLENDLGETLFERTRRGHTLTASGERFLSHAEKMESLTFEIETTIKPEQQLNGRVRIGTPEGVGTKILSRNLVQLRKRHPGIEVDLITLSGFVSVPKRQADMSILLNRPTTGRLKMKKLSDYSLHLYCSDDYARSSLDISSIDDLSEHVLIGYTEDLIYSSELRYLQDVCPDVKPKLCSTSINAQLEMVLSGAGLAILPDFLAQDHKQLQKVLANEVKVERNFWLAIHEDVANIARNRAVIDFLTSLKY